MNLRLRSSQVGVLGLGLLAGLAVSCTDIATPTYVDQECWTFLDCPENEACSCGDTYWCDRQNPPSCQSLGCMPDECGADAYCDDEMVCTGIEAACLASPSGCECHVLPSSGRLASTGVPRIVLPAGSTLDVQAVLAFVNGGVIPSDDFALVSLTSAAFDVDGKTLTALNAPGSGLLTVEFGTIATCSAEVVNLGPAPAGGLVRVYVYDALTGLPVENAETVIDIDSDGIDDGLAPPTDASGVAVSSQPVLRRIDLTVFAAGYDYVTLADLDVGAAADISMPLGRTAIGGAIGQPEFDAWEELIGGRKTIKLALSGTSLDFENLLGFGLPTLLGGELTDEDCSQSPTAAGCHVLNIPGILDNFPAPIWGGLVLSLANNPIKPQFEMAGSPGRRYIWSLGGEYEVADIGSLFSVVSSTATFCECEASPSVCDSECNCDPDCRGAYLGRVLRGLTPLAGVSSSGVAGNVAMAPVAPLDWENYLESARYPDRTIDGRFPVLDDRAGGRGRLPLQRHVRRFTDVTAPQLPSDPYWNDDTRMEGIVVVTGVVAPGAGFVPLGLGAAFDCGGSWCRGHVRAPDLEDYDGQINPQLACYYDPEPELNGCLPELLERVPHGELPAGHLSLFHSPAHSGLEGQPWRTLITALPTDSFDAEHYRATAIILDGEPSSWSMDLSESPFPAFAELPTSITGRVYSLNPTTSIDMHRVAIERADAVTGEIQKWHIVAPNVGRDIVLPAVPIGIADPLDNAGAAASVHVTHAGLWLQRGVAWQELYAHGAPTPPDLLEIVEGYSVRGEELALE